MCIVGLITTHARIGVTAQDEAPLGSLLQASEAIGKASAERFVPLFFAIGVELHHPVIGIAMRVAGLIALTRESEEPPRMNPPSAICCRLKRLS